MRFTGQEYFWAGVERMRQARPIHDRGGQYSLAMYTSGLAVECMLRAFRWKKDASFEGRHDLADLLKAGDLLQKHEEQLRKQGYADAEVNEYSRRLRVSLTEVVLLWHNNLRFASEASLRAHLNRIGRLQGIRGDPLKKNSLDLLNSAQAIIERGAYLWDLKKR